MSDATHGTGDGAGRGPSQRLVELAVAVIAGLFGVVIMYGSYKVGIGWGPEGPRSGFFPFYIGLIILAGSVINFWMVLRQEPSGDLFADWSQLRSVMSVVIPTAIYVAVLPVIGIYISSIVLIGGFMKWLGKYNWGVTLAVAIGVPVLSYVLFERWFLVPLPKGPVEHYFGL